MDAMLGAAGLRDIGNLFPDSDERFRGADSIKLLECVREEVRSKGYVLSNADCTIIAQRPKLAAHIPDMRKILAAAAGAELDCVNVKATTEEGLGFTGEGLGIAAHAVVLLKKI